MATTVFIYEDDPDWQKTLREMFEEDGFQGVHISDNLDEAKRSIYLLASALKLVLSDYSVQYEGDGQAFVDECRRLIPNVYIVGIGGSEGIKGADVNPGKFEFLDWYKSFLLPNKERFLG